MNNVVWIWIAIIGAYIGVYYLYKQGKLPWLKRLKMPKLFKPQPYVLTEKLKAQTKREVARAEELRGVLVAKTELAKAQAANIRLRDEIDGVSARSVEKDKRVAEQEKLDAEEAQKVKPKRL